MATMAMGHWGDVGRRVMWDVRVPWDVGDVQQKASQRYLEKERESGRN